MVSGRIFPANKKTAVFVIHNSKNDSFSLFITIQPYPL